MTRQSVSQVLRRFNAINDGILLYYTELFIELRHFIILRMSKKILDSQFIIIICLIFVSPK